MKSIGTIPREELCQFYNTDCFIANTVTFLVKIDYDDGTVNTDYAMRKLDMNHIMIGISSIGMEATTVLITSVYFAYS